MTAQNFIKYLKRNKIKQQITYLWSVINQRFINKNHIAKKNTELHM